MSYRAYIEDLQRLGKPIRPELIKEIESLKQKFISELRGHVPSHLLVDRMTYDEIAYTAFRYQDNASLGTDPYHPAKVCGLEIIVDYTAQTRILQVVSFPLPLQQGDESVFIENILKRLRGLTPNLPLSDIYYPIRFIKTEEVARTYSEALSNYFQKLGRKTKMAADSMMREGITLYAGMCDDKNKDRILKLFGF